MTMKKSATPTVQASGVFHRMPGVWRRAGSFLPARKLTFVVLLLAAVAFGGVFAVAQAQEAEGAINGLTLSSDSPGTLTVSWDTPSPAPTDYRVRWAQAESDYPSWKDDNETDRGNEYPAGGDTSLTLSGLSEETEFKVQVRARYSDGAHKDKPWSGPWTEEVRGRVMSQPPDVPSAPGAPNLSGTAATPEGHVMLVWQDPSDDSITGYQVLRGPDADNLVVIEEDTGSSGTSYTDTSPPAGRTHTYAVKARNAAGLSPPSNTVTAAVPEAEEEEEEELITSQQTSDATLVSNLGQMNVGTGRVSSSQEIAQAFVAGPGLASFGYRFEGIRVSAARDTFIISIDDSASARQPAWGRGRAPRSPTAHPDRAGRLRQHRCVHGLHPVSPTGDGSSRRRPVLGRIRDPERRSAPQDHEFHSRGPGPAAGRWLVHR